MNYEGIVRTCLYWSDELNWHDLNGLVAISSEADGIHICFSDKIPDIINEVAYITEQMKPDNTLKVKIIKETVGKIYAY
jgi:hypothetical protein